MQPTVIEYTTVDGIVLHLRTIGVATRQLLVSQASKLYPYPDPTPYRHQMENAIPGVETNPMDNPEFVKLVETADRERNTWYQHACIKLGVQLPDFPMLADLTKQFAALIEMVQKLIPDTDPYEIALFQGVLGWDVDYSAVMNLIGQNIQLELTASEVADGIRLFRYSLSGSR